MSKERLISLSEAAERLGVNVQTMRSWVSAGSIPAYRMGQRFTRVAWSEVLETLQERPELAEGRCDAHRASAARGASAQVETQHSDTGEPSASAQIGRTAAPQEAIGEGDDVA